MSRSEDVLDDVDELRRLQVEYVELIEGHPPSTWSPNLFRVVNAAIRLQFGDGFPGGLVGGRRNGLTLVR